MTTQKQLSLEDELMQTGKAPIVNYQPINSKKEYDRNLFAAHMDLLVSDLIKYEGKLDKNPQDEYTISKISKKLFGDKQFIMNQKDPVLFAKNAIHQAVDHGKKSIGFYVKNNLEEFFEKNDDQSLLQIAFSSPLCKDGDENYKKLVKKFNDVKEVSRMGENPQEMQSYVAKQIKESPRWLQRTHGTFGGTTEFNQYLFQSYHNVAQQKAIQEVSLPNGKLDKQKLEEALKHSLRIGWESFEEADDSGDMEDIYENTMLPIYWNLASGIFNSEYRESERRNNSHQQEMEDRWKKRNVDW
jgi:hypothetical protein